MSYINICPKCGKTGEDQELCENCNVKMVYSGYATTEWNLLSETDRQRKIREKVTGRESISPFSSTSDSNPIATALTIIAIIDFIGWFIIGIVLGRDFYDDFSIIHALLYWVIGAVSGIMLLGFSEIIKLLHSINNKA